MKIGAQVLNGMYGQSADGVRVRLERASDDGWELVASAQTDGAGRIPDWNGLHLDGGLYRIVFDSDSYFRPGREHCLPGGAGRLPPAERV